MRRASPQGYSGRRSYGGYGGSRGSKDEMGNIWEVVAALAKALQDARNQLVTLMKTSKSPMRLSGERCDSYEYCHSRHASPARTYSPYTGSRNVHRAHAHGHVAFGSSSEYPVHATPKRVRPREIYAEMSAQQATSPAAGRRCTHPLHGMGDAARNLSTSRRVQPSWPSGQVVGCRKSHSDELSRRDRACVNISSGKNQGSKNSSRNPSPDQRRHHCMGKQFAALLTHEAHQMRERRLAEEPLRDKRPSWCRS